MDTVGSSSILGLDRKAQGGLLEHNVTRVPAACPGYVNEYMCPRRAVAPCCQPYHR